jgi:hypothetical protein
MTETSDTTLFQNRILWWVIASICGPVMLALTGTLLNLGISNAQRISALESQVHSVQERLDRMDRKLDRILEAKERP